jgi:hypothetical protein
MHSFQLFSNRNRNCANRRGVGVPLEQLNGIPNNIMVSNIIAQQKKYPPQARSFKSSMINYVNSPSASCGCSGH